MLNQYLPFSRTALSLSLAALLLVSGNASAECGGRIPARTALMASTASMVIRERMVAMAVRAVMRMPAHPC